jgi:riboflavin kinase / FMN adenylyltransferase
VNIFEDFDTVGSIHNAVVTTGSFDGVHIAHKVILQRLKALAKETDGETVVITFHPHPRKVLFPDTLGKELWLLNSRREKIELLRKAGLDNLIIANFTLEFSRISAPDFVKNILLNKVHASKIVVGYNHHFGHNREGHYEELHQLGLRYGFEVEEIPEQDLQDESVSSENIRKALLEGNIGKANANLGYPYLIMGPVLESPAGFEDTGLDCFGIQIEDENKLLPPDGMYAVMAGNYGNEKKGVCMITKGDSSSAEAKVGLCMIEPLKLVPGDIATVFFHKFIRGMKDFVQTEHQREQLLKDRLTADTILSDIMK